jgi:hypothetical protein
MAAKALVKVRFGTQWLLTDQFATRINWVNDRMVATSHTREWATKFKADMIQDGKVVEIFSEAEVAERALVDRGRLLQQYWLNEFESQMRATYEATWTNEGFWSNAHMLYGKGLDVPKAVQLCGNKSHLNLKKKKA